MPVLPARLQRRLVVVGAAGLRKADTFGKSDPYAVVKLDGVEVGRTTVAPKTLSPSWQHAVALALRGGVGGGGSLRLEVYDHDKAGAHDLLGALELELGCDVFATREFKLEGEGTVLLRLEDPTDDAPMPVSPLPPSPGARSETTRGGTACMHQWSGSLVSEHRFVACFVPLMGQPPLPKAEVRAAMTHS